MSTESEREREWFNHAACRGSTTDLFYPDPPGNNNRARASSGARGRSTIRVFCTPCVVRKQCLQWAVDRKECHGIWGGTTSAERLEDRRMTASLKAEG